MRSSRIASLAAALAVAALAQQAEADSLTISGPDGRQLRARREPWPTPASTPAPTAVRRENKAQWKRERGRR